jgi:putative hemolysin
VNGPLAIILILLLIAGNAFFVIAEYALVTARRNRLVERSEEGSRGATVALKLMDNPVRFISTVQVGITALGILLGAVGERILREFFEPVVATSVAFVLAFAIVTYLSVTFGELVPKAIALEKAEAVAIAVAIPVDWISRITYPIVWVLQTSAQAVLKLFGIRSSPSGVVIHTEDDIRDMIEEAEDTGVIEEAEEEMLYKVFDFADKEVSHVMVPRPEVRALSVELPAQECLAAVIDSPHTRYPAYRETLDDIVGVLHVRDLFSALWEDGIANVHIEGILRPVYAVPATKDLGAMLAEFRREKLHMAIVIDEFGSTQGIVTLEDLLEQIVGEIDDEYDLPDESIEEIDDSTIRLYGTFTIDDFNDQFRENLPLEDFNTLAGFVFGELGRSPEEGNEVYWNGLRFEVLSVEGARIERLEVEFLDLVDADGVDEPTPA